MRSIRPFHGRPAIVSIKLGKDKITRVVLSFGPKDKSGLLSTFFILLELMPKNVKRSAVVASLRRVNQEPRGSFTTRPATLTALRDLPRELKSLIGDDGSVVQTKADAPKILAVLLG